MNRLPYLSKERVGSQHASPRLSLSPTRLVFQVWPPSKETPRNIPAVRPASLRNTLVKTTMLFGFVGLTAMASSDSFRCRWLTSTFVGPAVAGTEAMTAATIAATRNTETAMPRRIVRCLLFVGGASEGYMPRLGVYRGPRVRTRQSDAGQDPRLHRPEGERQRVRGPCCDPTVDLVDLHAAGRLPADRARPGRRRRLVVEQHVIAGADGVEVAVDDHLTGPVLHGAGVGHDHDLAVAEDPRDREDAAGRSRDGEAGTVAGDGPEVLPPVAQC